MLAEPGSEKRYVEPKENWVFGGLAVVFFAAAVVTAVVKGIETFFIPFGIGVLFMFCQVLVLIQHHRMHAEAVKGQLARDENRHIQK